MTFDSVTSFPKHVGKCLSCREELVDDSDCFAFVFVVAFGDLKSFTFSKGARVGSGGVYKFPMSGEIVTSFF